MKHALTFSCLILTILSLNGCGQTYNKYLKDQLDGLYGVLITGDHEIFFELYYQKAPLTVTSFVGLATAKFEENIEKKGAYFDGLTFHRVIPEFVIQGGDPTASGSGGPGYSFQDEFDESLKHDQVGTMSMANSGPGTNGSQFFITLAPTPHLDNKHSIFGKVLIGLEVLPLVKQDDIIDQIIILPKGEDAEAFVNNTSWDAFEALKTELKQMADEKNNQKKQEIISMLESDTTFTKTIEGIFYKIERPGKGRQIKNGDTASVHYELTVYNNSKIIDSSYSRDVPFDLKVGSGQVISGWEIILQQLKKGDKALVVIPPELGYGELGAGGGVIPPYAFLQFVMEIVDIK